MAVSSTQEGCDSLPNEEHTVSHCELPVTVSNSVDVCVPLKIQLSLDDQMMMLVDDYSEFIEKELDIEKGKLETPKANEETAGNLKTEEEQMKEISFEMGGKYMQLLMNDSLFLPKFSTRDKSACVEGPRMRKYKHTASFSFNSRKVALMFSVLSILGTIILIYLTLRVKQSVENTSK